MDGANLLAQRAYIKVIKLRTLATKGYNEYLELFNKIEKDPKCNEILRNSHVLEKNPEIAQWYNEHIRQSKLSDGEQKQLFI